jgi:hypothetical protein
MNSPGEKQKTTLHHNSNNSNNSDNKSKKKRNNNSVIKIIPQHQSVFNSETSNQTYQESLSFFLFSSGGVSASSQCIEIEPKPLLREEENEHITKILQTARVQVDKFGHCRVIYSSADQPGYLFIARIHLDDIPDIEVRERDKVVCFVIQTHSNNLHVVEVCDSFLQVYWAYNHACIERERERQQKLCYIEDMLTIMKDIVTHHDENNDISAYIRDSNSKNITHTNNNNSNSNSIIISNNYSDGSSDGDGDDDSNCIKISKDDSERQ